MKLTELLPLALPDLPGCPEFVVLEALRDAARDFCLRARCLLHPTPVVADPHGPWPFMPLPADHEVCDVLPGSGVTLDEYGQLHLPPALATYGRQVPACLVLRPNRSAQQLDDRLYAYRRGIASGTVQLLAASAGKDWSNPELARYHGKLFTTAIVAANRATRRAAGQTPRRSKASFL